jgi:hypothetical protein
VPQVAALCITGIEKLGPGLQKLQPGVFTLNVAQPEANGRPHYSTTAGGHLYYSIGGSWYLGTEFTPDEKKCSAWIKTVGEVPAGEMVWEFYDVSLKGTDGTMGRWVDRKLTVIELLSAAVVADAERAAAEAAAVWQWRAAGGTSAAVRAESASASVESVCLWLCEEGFDHVVAGRFEAAGITGERLAHLDGAALQNIGVRVPTTRARLLGLHPLPALRQGVIGCTERILAEEVWPCLQRPGFSALMS